LFKLCSREAGALSSLSSYSGALLAMLPVKKYHQDKMPAGIGQLQICPFYKKARSPITGNPALYIEFV
jgi:hypothetical protein